MKSLQVLDDVMIMRPIVIFLLIVTHSFTMFTGGTWKLPDGIHEIEVYGDITRIAFSFMLETFVFISGYLYAMQLQRKETLFIPFLVKKVQRLVFPSIIFSIAYIACFNLKDFASVGVVYDIFNGAGHLWFLPMLFWCFIMVYCINSVKGYDKIKLILCFSLSLLSGLLPFNFFRIANACYYILFFYLGMFIFSRRQKIISRLTCSNVIFLVAIYILSYILFSEIKQILTNIEGLTLTEKILRIVGIKLSTIIYSGAGLFMLFAIVNYALKRCSSWRCPVWLYSINSMSFGIYIYQQFILIFLYYHTSLPNYVGTYILPWVGLITAILVSIIFSNITIKTRFGRFLIG